MAPENALHLLLNQSEESVKSATAQLGKSNSLVTQLEAYKGQIVHNLEQPNPEVLTVSDLRNRTAWRARLHLMEASCDRALDEAQHQATQAKRDVVTAQTEKLKFETIIDRRDKLGQKKEAKKEQKLNDEFAAAAWRRRMTEEAKRKTAGKPAV
jgi:flagellar export protein FliJ